MNRRTAQPRQPGSNDNRRTSRDNRGTNSPTAGLDDGEQMTQARRNFLPNAHLTPAQRERRRLYAINVMTTMNKENAPYLSPYQSPTEDASVDVGVAGGEEADHEPDDLESAVGSQGEHSAHEERMSKASSHGSKPSYVMTRTNQQVTQVQIGRLVQKDIFPKVKFLNPEDWRYSEAGRSVCGKVLQGLGVTGNQDHKERVWESIKKYVARCIGQKRNDRGAAIRLVFESK